MVINPTSAIIALTLTTFLMPQPEQSYLGGTSLFSLQVTNCGTAVLLHAGNEKFFEILSHGHLQRHHELESPPPPDGIH